MRNHLYLFAVVLLRDSVRLDDLVKVRVRDDLEEKLFLDMILRMEVSLLCIYGILRIGEVSVY